MTTRPLVLAAVFTSAVLTHCFEIGASELAYPEATRHMIQARVPASKQLPERPLSALVTATQVARIDDAFRATNDLSRIRTQTAAAGKSGNVRSRPVALPTAAAIAVVNAAEPRPAAPAMKPFNDSQVVTVSYAAPIPSMATATTELAPNSDNPLRNPIAGSSTLHAANPGTSTPPTNNPLR